MSESPGAAFRADVDALVAQAAAKLGLASLPALEVPPDSNLGDLGLPCFSFAKAMRLPPPAIAQKVAEAIALPPGGFGWVSAVAAAGPYVNFTLDRARLAAAVLADPEAVLTAPRKAETILLEHTSANPNGPLHVGRARNPILGDTLARIYRAAGYTVEAQYYMDNLGRQVATLSWGKWNLDPATLPPAARPKMDHDLVRYYQAAHELASKDKATGQPKDAAVAAAIKALVEELESADPKVLAKVRPVYEACFAGMRETLTRFGAHYDSIKDESDVVLDGSVATTIDALKRLAIAGVDETGANYLDLSGILKGQKDKFFFTRRDGTSVYATRDIAYHAWKAKQVAGKGRLVNVLGEDHKLQALQVGTALDALGISRPTVLFYSFVSLPEGKMSTRANRVVFLDDLMDEAASRAYDEVKQRRGDDLPEAQLRAIAEAVGIAAVRFNIARIQPEKPIEFRWEEALSFDGDSAPYLMYAHARAASLLAKAKAEGLTTKGAAPAGEGELRLAHAIGRFVPVAEEAARQNAPHRMAAYALELAAAFNDYYRDHRVLECEDPTQRALRLRMVEAARIALARTLRTLAVEPIDAM